MKKKLFSIIVILLLFSPFSCTTIRSGTDGLSLLEGIEHSAEQIAEKLPIGSRIVIMAFKSSHDNLSEYLRKELEGAFSDRGFEIAVRGHDLENLRKELGFQMSGEVNDASAKSIGKFLSADIVITGEFTDYGDSYRYRTSAVYVEKAVSPVNTRLTIRNDREIQRVIKAIEKQGNKAETGSYNNEVVLGTAGSLLDRGISLAVKREFDLAIENFTEAIQLNPNMVGAYILRGRTLVASVSQVGSIEDNFGGIGLLIDNEKVTNEQIQVYDQAIADFNYALSLDPNNAVIYIERGSAYSVKGELDQAIADSNQAIRLNPNYARAYNDRGFAYYRKKDYDRAIKDYDEAIRLDLDDPNATQFRNRGNVYYAKGDYDQAIANYTQAMQFEFHHPAWLYYDRGVTYFWKNDYRKAITDFTRAIKFDPNYFWAYLERGLVYNVMKRYDRAISDFNLAIRLNPYNADAYNGRGAAYSWKGNFIQAKKDYETALKINPAHSKAKENLKLLRQ